MQQTRDRKQKAIARVKSTGQKVKSQLKVLILLVSIVEATGAEVQKYEIWIYN